MKKEDAPTAGGIPGHKKAATRKAITWLELGLIVFFIFYMLIGDAVEGTFRTFNLTFLLYLAITIGVAVVMIFLRRFGRAALTASSIGSVALIRPLEAR